MNAGFGRLDQGPHVLLTWYRKGNFKQKNKQKKNVLIIQYSEFFLRRFSLLQWIYSSEHKVMWTLTWVVAPSSMEFYNVDSVEEGDECPVCYESLVGRDRTLSCQHVFCHDCLVKTLLSISTNGNLRDNIICPICQHATFIKRQKEEPRSSSQDKNRGQLQLLEVPLPGAASNQERSHRFSRCLSQRAEDWIATCLWWISTPVRRNKPMGRTYKASQLFVITMERRPVTEADEPITVVVQPLQRRRCTCCEVTGRMAVLLLAFTLLAASLVILIIIPLV